MSSSRICLQSGRIEEVVIQLIPRSLPFFLEVLNRRSRFLVSNGGLDLLCQIVF